MSSIFSQIIPIYELDELQEIFDYPNRRSLNRALNNGTLPLKLFKLRNRRVCHVAVVEQYFDKMKKDGMLHRDETLEEVQNETSDEWDR